MKTKNIALIFAGGTGERMNSKSVPKQFLKVYGKPIIIYTLEQFEQNKKIDAIIVASLGQWIDYLNQIIKRYDITKVVSVIEGGETGQLSIYKTLCKAKELYDDDAIVLVHDGVRPLIDQKTISNCIVSTQKYGNGITTTKATETVIVSTKDLKSIDEIVQRSRCKLARAPQAFKLKDLYGAHEKALAIEKTDSIDSATLMAEQGHTLYTVPGPVENIKITTPIDFYMFRGILDAKENQQVFS